MTNTDIIVIALPAGDMPFVFPMGTIDLVQRLGRPVRGYYVDELSDEVIRAARLAVIPVHWFYSLQPAIDISRRLRRINPGIKIISGGFTAGAYPDDLLGRSEIDFIVRGDAEVPFVRLVSAILDMGKIDEIPNLNWQGGSTPLDYQIDETTLAESNNRDVSWFPSFERAALATQKLRDVSFIYPWIVVARGCSFDCEQCFASRASQQYLAGRGMICRPPEAVKEDLRYWSRRSDIRWCHFNSDFHATMKDEWAEAVLDESYDLTAYYECYRTPDIQFAQAMIDSYEQVVFGMFYRPDAQCAHAAGSHSDTDYDKLFDVVRHCRDRARILLYITPQLVAGNPGYYNGTRRLIAAGRLEIKNYDESIIPPIAEQNDKERQRGFEHLLHESVAAQERLARQHGLLAFAMLKFRPLYRLLWKASIARVGLKMLLTQFTHHGFGRRAKR
jgi:hypothetical protein